MTKQITNSKKGFTIIEVVLVLAVAGLIFLMVFVALPAMQKNQRETTRKNNYSLIASSIVTYQGNNRNKLPSTSADISVLKTYIDSGNLSDPGTGKEYNIEIKTGKQDAPTTAGTVYIVTGGKCNGQTETVKEDGKNAVLGYSENTGICVDV